MPPLTEDITAGRSYLPLCQAQMRWSWPSFRSIYSCTLSRRLYFLTHFPVEMLVVGSGTQLPQALQDLCAVYKIDSQKKKVYAAPYTLIIFLNGLERIYHGKFLVLSHFHLLFLKAVCIAHTLCMFPEIFIDIQTNTNTFIYFLCLFFLWRYTS